MAKKKETQPVVNYHIDPVSQDSENDVDVTDAVTAQEESQPEVLEVPPPPEQVYELQDAARRLLPGFQEHWLPGILAEAKSLGFSGTGTMSECIAVLRRWGAQI